MRDTKEYNILRSELEDNIKKQDSLFALVFTILGVTSVFSTWYENIAFLILVLFITALLQVKVLECRNVVYYISTYLKVIENKYHSEIQWESRIAQFKDVKYKPILHKTYIYVLAIKIGRLLKHFGNLAFSLFIFFRIINMAIYDINSFNNKVINIILAAICLILNILYTYVICTDRAILPIYTEKWQTIIFEHSADNNDLDNK